MSVAIPKMTYRADIWYNPPMKKLGAKQQTGSVRVMRQLMRVQWMATLAISEALCTTPTDMLDIHTGILPLELAMTKACHRSLI